MIDTKIDKMQRVQERAEMYRKGNEAFAKWAAGYGVIKHTDLTQCRIFKMAEHLELKGVVKDKEDILGYLHSADRIASAGMWLVGHMTYARNVYLDGRDLAEDDFKSKPEGHTGGALNIVIAYTGYMAINAITGITRSWLMGQGHCVAGIDSINLILDNMTKAHAERYDLSDEGLSKFVRDFYLLKVTPEGHPVSPIGSHVNVHTAGGMIEGGYLGFAELLYSHMPLPGDRLVTFLSDGAFEEQKGGDWVPRWWRNNDCGLVAPIMIANGRRIDQRTTVSMQGGVDWFREHLELNNFEPFDIDGRDPAAYAWAIWEMEERLSAHGKAVEKGLGKYPVPLPYTIAEVPKGFGLPNAGTNAAHNLPVEPDTASNPASQKEFNMGVRQLWVPLEELKDSIKILNNQKQTNRPQERDHSLKVRQVEVPSFPETGRGKFEAGKYTSPMIAVDDYFCKIVEANPQLRARVGNPDEIHSNRLIKTRTLLKHRVTDPEPGTEEALDGKIITALNEEAIVAAALGNKGGLNLVASYEAFTVKMLGAVRQELIFARHQREGMDPPGWLGVPVIATSHTWENGKNEISHQDPTFAEALMGEMTDCSRVLFAGDANSAVAILKKVYQSHGQIWALVIPKRATPEYFDEKQSEQLVEDGAIYYRKQDGAKVSISAFGAYQFAEAVRASDRLNERGIANNVIYMAEPTKFRNPRDKAESQAVASLDKVKKFYPDDIKARIFISHTRTVTASGVLRQLDTGNETTKFLGYINRGGTLDEFGMLFANRCTWGHIILAASEVLDARLEDFLDDEELKAVRGEGSPEILR